MPPIDPPVGPRYALGGRVVTMNGAFDVHDKARIYIEHGSIRAVVPEGDDVPPELADVKVVGTRGTIYPGLIELHNHLSYNALPPWVLPRKFAHRGQWPRHPGYRTRITGPASVLGTTEGLVESVVRYVEAKCLLAGVTTSQGVTLKANNGIRRHYRGLVRNVEQTGDDELPAAATRIEDVAASSAERFLERLSDASTLLLHLSEGIGPTAQKHFRALNVRGSTWAITNALAGIHCTGLVDDDFSTLHTHGGTMVWSPLSNLLLYGATADIARAHDAGVLIAIGSDWSPSGSKNLLGELKVARLWSEKQGGVFTARDIVAMVTRNPARILKWEDKLGALIPGARADLMVLEGTTGDVYDDLVAALEDDISLVVINGAPRCGRPTLMARFEAPVSESLTVGGEPRDLSLAQESADPLVGAITLATARERLSDALQRLPELAARLEDPLRAFAVMGSRESRAAGDTARADPNEARWVLDFDHEPADGLTSRPQLPVDGERTGIFRAGNTAEPLSQILEPMTLDALTIVDDEDFGRILAEQPNVDDEIKRELARLHRKRLPALPRPVARVRSAIDQPPPQTLRDLLETLGDVGDTARAELATFTACLPFGVAEVREGTNVRWIVERVAIDPPHPSFVAGVELRYWNGTPIARIAGTYSRDLRTLTERPLGDFPPPEEEWVTVTYRALDGRRREIRRRWLVKQRS